MFAKWCAEQSVHGASPLQCTSLIIYHDSLTNLDNQSFLNNKGLSKFILDQKCSETISKLNNLQYKQHRISVILALYVLVPEIHLAQACLLSHEKDKVVDKMGVFDLDDVFNETGKVYETGAEASACWIFLGRRSG